MAQHWAACLTVFGPLTLIGQIEQGRLMAQVADEMGVWRTAAPRWLSLFRAEGESGRLDRPSVTHRRPHQTPE